MVALTPNRGYPYSTPTDNNDVPAALQAFAEAVDPDIQALYDAVPAGRQVARVRGTIPTFYPVGGTVTRFQTFNETLLNVGDAIEPVPSTTNGTINVRPLWPGYWVVLGVLTYFPHSQVITTEVGLQRGGLTLEVLARQSAQVIPTASDGVRNLTVCMGSFMNGTTDTFQFFTTLNKTSSATHTSGERTLTMFRMTES